MQTLNVDYPKHGDKYTQQTFVLMKTSWRHRLGWSSEYVFKASPRHMFALVIRLQKTSSRHLETNIFEFVLAIRLQDIFKTSLRRFQKVFKTFAKTSSRHLEDVFKTSSRSLAKTSSRHLQDVFKTYHQAKLFLVTRLREVFNLLLRRNPKMAIYKGICLGHTTSEKFMVSAQNLQER